ncbi:MAG: phosphatidylserine/phosphatidylglycerophosphate/cardiolipin synthase family protein, partial [Spirochaetota bacterium]
MIYTINKTIPSPRLKDIYKHLWIPSKKNDPKNIFVGDDFTNLIPVDKEQILLKNIIDSIRAAEETIFIASFLFSHKEITSSLKEAAKRGVRVYLLTASENKLNTSPEEGDFEKRTLEEHKTFLNEMAKLILIRSAENFHFKLLLIDVKKKSRQGFLFTNNITEKALLENPEIGLELSSQSTIELANFFSWCFWEKATHEQSLQKSHRAVKTPGKLSYIPSKTNLIFSGKDIFEKDRILPSLMKMIQSAKQTIEIASFSFGDENSQLTKLLCEKAKDNVSIHVYGRESRFKQYDYFQFLQQKQIKIFGIPLLHFKLVLIDKNKGILMTANLDDRSLTNSYEIGKILNLEEVFAARQILEAYKKRYHFEYFDKLTGKDLIEKDLPVDSINFYPSSGKKREVTINKAQIQISDKRKISCLTELLHLQEDTSKVNSLPLCKSISYKWEIELPYLASDYKPSEEKLEEKHGIKIYIKEGLNKKKKPSIKDKV